jgi:hypothetical protein
MFKLRDKTLVVFEGPDNSGKTSLMKELIKLFPTDFFTHQPSGDLQFTQDIYKLTEENDDISNLSRQLLHLAAHVEHYDRVVRKVMNKGNGVFMDRCYVSTMVYGWYNGDTIKKRIPEGDFWKLVQMPAGKIKPEIIYFCEHVYEPDKHNTPGVIGGYSKMARALAMPKVPPNLSPPDRAMWVAQDLKRLALATGKAD